MQIQIRDPLFTRSFARRILNRPSHVLANSVIEIHDRTDGLEVHILTRREVAICFAWIHGRAYLLPGTSAVWLTVDDLFGLEDVVNELIAACLRRHDVRTPRTKRGAA